jgi:precorrin-6B methylase 2
MSVATTRQLFPFTITFMILTGYCAWADQDAQTTPVSPSQIESDETYYTTCPPSADGIGKVYMGREISQVLELKPDNVVADIGAGSGYFTMPLARSVSNGKVLAVDIQPKMLEMLQQKSKSLGITNVTPVLGTITNPNLPESSVDVVLMVDAYHEFSNPREMMDAIVTGLKPGGRVVLVEFRAEDPKVMIKPLHKMTEAQVRLEMDAVGLEWIATKHDLPRQHVLIFSKPEPTKTTGESDQKTSS